MKHSILSKRSGHTSPANDLLKRVGCVAVVGIILLSGSANAASILWSSAGGSAWLTGTNWTGNAVPGGTDIAQFGANPTGSSGVGINFNNATNAGTQLTGQRIENVGAIEITSARAASFLIGNSSTTTGATGTLQLVGATVNNVNDVIIRNNSSQLLTIQNTQGSGNQTMDVQLGDAIDNKIYIEGNGGVTISSAIKNGAGVNTGNLTLNGTGSGILTLSGAAANTYNGATTVKVGELDLNKTTAGVDAIAGNLVVGSGTGAGNAAIVKLLGSNQIKDSSGVTINSDGQLNIQSFSDTVGAVVLVGGNITGSTGVLTGSSYDVRAGSVDAILGGSGDLTKTTAGTVTLSKKNTYTGTTTVATNGGTLQVDNNGTNTLGKITGTSAAGSITVGNGGTLLLKGAGNNDRIANDAGTTLAAGSTLAIAPTGGSSQAVLEGTGAHNQGGTFTGTNTTGLGALTLTGNATLDMGASGVGTLNFASFSPGGFVLNITNYTSVANSSISGTDTVDDRLIFATDQATNLGSFSFSGLSAQEIALGSGYYEIVPVPEPSTYVAGALTLLALAWKQRRRVTAALTAR